MCFRKIETLENDEELVVRWTQSLYPPSKSRATWCCPIVFTLLNSQTAQKIFAGPSRLCRDYYAVLIWPPFRQWLSLLGGGLLPKDVQEYPSQTANFGPASFIPQLLPNRTSRALSSPLGSQPVCSGRSSGAGDSRMQINAAQDSQLRASEVLVLDLQERMVKDDERNLNLTRESDRRNDHRRYSYLHKS